MRMHGVGQLSVSVLMDCECGAQVPCPGYVEDRTEYIVEDAIVGCPTCGTEFMVELDQDGGVYLLEMADDTIRAAEAVAGATVATVFRFTAALLAGLAAWHCRDYPAAWTLWATCVTVGVASFALYLDHRAGAP